MERLKTRIVGPDGPLDAKICFVPQAPGEVEDTTGRAMTGPTGRFFDRCLSHVGLSRGNVLIRNVFMQRPPKNDIHYYFQDKSCNKLTWEGQEHVDALRSWLEGLLWDRKNGLQRPNVLMALGREAMYVLTGKKRITKWRGSLLPCTLVEGFKVYVSYHPSYVLRLMNEPSERLAGDKKKLQQNVLPLFLKDLERAKEQMEFPELRLPKRSFSIASSLHEVLDFIDLAKTKEAISVDIETLPGESGPIVWCVGLGLSPDVSMTIPFIRQLKLFWSSQEEAQIWRALSELFLSPVKKVFQLGSYDLSILGRYYGLRVADRTYEDIGLCHQSTYPFLLKGLDLQTSIYTWEPYYKDEGKVHSGKRISDDAEFIYNGKDCCVTREIYPIVLSDARELRTIKNYENTIKVFPSILYMQIRGVRIDLEKKKQLAKDFTERARMAQETVNLLAGKEYLITSPKQMKQLLYVELDLPVQYQFKTKKVTADKDAINRLLKKYKDPASRENKILKAITEARKFSKLATTYTSMKLDSDGRVRTSYTWVSTFRLSSSESHFGGGGNLQNIPTRTEEGREIRKLFIPDEGKVFLAGDGSQAEAREVAWLANDKRLMEMFASGDLDVHWERAKEIFQLPRSLPYEPKTLYQAPIVEEEHPLKFYRQLGKTIVHAFNYRMGPRMLQTILIREGVFLSEALCRQLLFRAKSANPCTVRWQEYTIEQIKATRSLVTPFGDIRYFRGRLNDNLFRSAIAYIPQSTVGRIIQLGQQRLYSECSIFEPLLNVHDETMGQCAPEDVEQCGKEIRRCLEIEHKVGDHWLTIPIDLKWSPTSWGEMEDL